MFEPDDDEDDDFRERPAPAEAPAPLPPLPPPPPPSGAPWALVAVLTLLLGASLGGFAVHVFHLTHRPDPEIKIVPGPAPPPEIHYVEIREPRREGSAPASEPDQPTTKTAATAPPAATATPTAATAQEEILDTSPAGLRKRFGPAVVELRTFSEDGETLGRAPAFLATPQRVAVPLAAIAGAASATVTASDDATYTVTGVIAQDAAFDLALLELAAPAPIAPLAIRFAPPEPGAAESFTLLSVAVDAKPKEQAIAAAQGGIEPIAGGPRLALATKADFPGVAIDAQGRAVALVAETGTTALSTHLAASWIASTEKAVPLDQFAKAAGPGAPTARLKRARQLIAENRLVEGVRLMLVITGEEPRLIPDVRVELRDAALSYARESVAGGDVDAATVLLTEVLARLPQEAELWAMKGRALFTQSNPESAVDCFRAAAAADAVRGDALLAEASGLLLDAAKQRQASGLLASAIGLLLDQRRWFTKDGTLRMEAAAMLLEARRFGEAADLFGEAAIVDPRLGPTARPKADRARDLAGGPGAIVVDYAPGSDTIVVQARVNANVTVSMKLDASEDVCVIPIEVALRSGYSVNALPRIRYSADPSLPEVPTVQLASVSVNGVGSSRVQAIVADGFGGPLAQGVLGESFLNRFRRVEDAAIGRLVLYPR